MANLTHSERVVRRISDLNPIAGHALVIFDQRQGHKFVRVVLDGEFYRPPRTWPFLPGRYYVAYAINTHPNLRLRFSDRFIHHNQVDSYDLNFTVDYHIDNDRERLRAIAVAFSADPLSQLRREIKRIFGSDVASLEWEWIRNDFTSDRWTEGSPALERARKFAQDMGITVDGVEVRLRLPEDALEAQVLRRREVIETEKQPFHETISRLEHQRALDSERRQEELKDIGRMGKIKDNFVARVDTAVGHLADSVDSPEKFRQAADVLRETISQGLIAKKGDEDRRPQLSGGDTRHLLAAREDPLAAILDEMLVEVRKLTCPSTTKRRILSTLLHLFAEIILDEDADEESLGRYEARSRDEISDGKLSFGEMSNLRRFSDRNSLREFIRS